MGRFYTYTHTHTHTHTHINTIIDALNTPITWETRKFLEFYARYQGKRPNIHFLLYHNITGTFIKINKSTSVWGGRMAC